MSNERQLNKRVNIIQDLLSEVSGVLVWEDQFLLHEK